MSIRKDDVSAEFNRGAAGGLPETDFCAFLIGKFGRDAAAEVLGAFKKMGLPPPQGEKEFLVGTEGCLVFLNTYGLVLRIEITNLEDSQWGADRINDSGWIVQPIGTIAAGKATIEVCPGCHLAQNPAYRGYLLDHLQNQNVNFWDTGMSNIGHLPFKSPSFPDGVPVVIDRLSVIRLTRNTEPIRAALKALAEEARQAQEKLYAPLRAAFADVGGDGGNMARFWALCLDYVAEGKLVAGWKKADRRGAMKSWDAAEAAKRYAVRLKRPEKP